MVSIVSIAILSCFALYLVYNIYLKNGETVNTGKKDYGPVIILILAAFAVRMVAGGAFPGYETDMGCFHGWSERVYNKGFSQFYLEGFADYPPGYVYVLWVVGYLKTIFGDGDLLVKLPAILCDIAAGVFVYKIALKRFSGFSSAVIAGLFLLSPAVILNSAIWGQVDIVYTLAVAVGIYLVYKKMLISSYFVFALAIFIKPQALIFTPVFLIAFFEEVLRHRNLKKIVLHVIYALAAIGITVLLSIPFGLENVIKQYINTLGSYPYATVNAFNIYGAFNLNWTDLTTVYSLLGTVFIVLIVFYTLYNYFKGNKNYFFLAGMLIFATYMLSTKMHERYAYPAMLMFLLAYAVNPRRESIGMFLLTTFSQIVNTAFVLFIAEQDINYYAKSPFIIVFSVVNIVILGYMIYASCKMTKPAPKIEKTEVGEVVPYRFKTRKIRGIEKKDYILILILCLVYGGISFYDLGNTTAPQSYEDVAGTDITVDFDDGAYVDKFVVYPSCNDIYEDRAIILTCTLEDGTEEVITYDEAAVFCWNFLDVGRNVNSIAISTNSERLMLMEAGFLGSDGLYDIKSDSRLFDEQNMIPERKTYLNSTIFDEIYHARTGYEFINGYNVYEWTHPPLGKVFISLGIKAFGMTPFGWRVVGNIFGILMIPLLYFFAKRMFTKTHIAFFTTVLFSFDFMHFVQTRIATIDVYVTFFIIMMYAFMYRYYQTSFYDTPLKKTFVPLLLTGVAFGLGAASKWTAIYACAGIAILFFGIMYRRYFEYMMLGGDLKFMSKFFKTCAFCVLAFIIIPVLIYALSYIPYLNTENAQGLKTIIDNQSDMYIYHSETVLGSSHPYASKWYTWLIMLRPVFYYSGTTAEGLKEGISAFGNPAVWWLGLIAVVFNIYLAFVKRDRKAIYLLVGYFACLLPWIPVARTTYMYHYFPCVTFMVMMTGRAYEYLYYRNGRLEKRLFAAHVVIALILFAMFYPVLSGHGASEWYVETFLRWLKNTWTLII